MFLKGCFKVQILSLGAANNILFPGPRYIDKKNNTLKYWIETSDEDFKVMNNLYKSGHYHWSLFIGYLVVEKLLKAIFVKKYNKPPVFSHDLVRIAEKINMILDEEKKGLLDTITTFNISARYDDYKRVFYKKCTKQFSLKWINNIKEIRKWLKENYLK